MYSRIIQFPTNQSFFLFGPRGTGKTTLLKQQFPEALYLDLLESDLYTSLLARPAHLKELITPHANRWIIIDEVQRVPELLQEVHRLIESSGLRFILTGSNSRKLKRSHANLLAGRAWTYHLYPLTAAELGKDFDLQHALQWGSLPSTYTQTDPAKYLHAYVQTYLREEIQQEGLTRNLSAFSRFLETISFSQAQVLNVSSVARDAAVNRKVVENYITILEDLLIANRLPVFTKKAKRKTVQHPKFFFFDSGVFRTIRPTGPLDSDTDIDGPALETVVYQEIKAINDYKQLGYTLFYWRTMTQQEVDFVLYGKRGLIAIEVKRARKVSTADLRGLRSFCADYPTAKPILLYTGDRQLEINGVTVLPIEEFLRDVERWV